jgi:hypothetical protein
VSAGVTSGSIRAGSPSDPGSSCDHLDLARGDAQQEFAEAAARDGIELVPQYVNWLNQRGHLGLPDDDERRPAREALERIYLALEGDLEVLDAGRVTAWPGDFIHEPTGTLIEVDESQHFTSCRLATSVDRQERAGCTLAASH